MTHSPASQLTRLGICLTALTSPYLLLSPASAVEPVLRQSLEQVEVETHLDPALPKSIAPIAQPEVLTHAEAENPPKIAQTPTAGRSLTVEELRGRVTVNERPAQVGDRIVTVGDRLTTGPNSTARLRLDSNIGVVEVAENTTVEIQVLSGGGNVRPVTELFVTEGRIRLSIARSAGIPDPTAQTETSESLIAGLPTLTGLDFDELAQQQTSSGSATTSPVRVRTPAGVAGVRGTSFGVNVGPMGKTGVSTIDGAVGVNAQGEEVLVNRGFFSVINPGSPPTLTELIPPLSVLRVFNARRTGIGAVRVFGQVDPMDLVFIDNRPIQTDAEGRFDTMTQLPGNRRLRIVVRGPAVRERHYDLPVQ